MAAYRAAKERLFTALLAPGRPAVLNRDSDEFGHLAALCRERGHPVLAYGTDAAAELHLVSASPRDRGQDVVIEAFGRRHAFFLPLLGAFQAMNALAALGLAIATEVPLASGIAALNRVSGVPGRMQFVAGSEAGGGIVVDYAHTPDALASVLAALRRHAPGRLIVLFGAGGDRDPGKRPLMGQIASAAADRVYVTDDNPRSEDPAAIRRAILAAAPGAIEIGDRRRAIATAIAELGPGDLLVIAGKGHEIGQIVGDETLPFDDAEVARELAAKRAHDLLAAPV
jgi:UDP-N-acetylmuramoyl-L-alanyl-D-glutamate--2,6-diaminopimelate ligase